MRIKHNKIKAGDVFQTNEGGLVTVVEHRGWDDITVEHNDKFKHRSIVNSGNLRAGAVKNPYHRSVHGIGYVGVGVYGVMAAGKPTSAYKAWSEMVRRCYDPKSLASKPTYRGCTVAAEWHNFQVFAKWFNDQPNSKRSGFALDKDLLVLNSKVYSSATCSFVPQEINKLLAGRSASRGACPQGVSAHYGGFRASLNVNAKQLKLGTYSTPEQAFSVYKKAKEENVKSVATEWKDWIHPDVYKNLMEWTL